jgi:hypothetical protein
MHRDVKLNFADDQGETELDKDNVKHYQVIIGSLMYAGHATRQDIT